MGTRFTSRMQLVFHGAIGESPRVISCSPAPFAVGARHPCVPSTFAHTVSVCGRFRAGDFVGIQVQPSGTGFAVWGRPVVRGVPKGRLLAEYAKAGITKVKRYAIRG
jgi:hypothetical protein